MLFSLSILGRVIWHKKCIILISDAKISHMQLFLDFLSLSKLKKIISHFGKYSNEYLTK